MKAMSNYNQELNVTLSKNASVTTTPATNKNPKLEFPRFEDNQVSTMTFIVMTNLEFLIEKIFHILPVTEYVVVPKPRGRRKKEDKVDPNLGIPDGSIITLKYLNNTRGVDLKGKKSFFRNSMTVVMVIDGKHINFKVSRNGKFQMTGCKTDKHAKQVVEFMWNYISQYEGVYSFSEGERPWALFDQVMRNIDFSIKFKIIRDKLDAYVNTHTDYNSLYEPSAGYTGVNIKMPVEYDKNKLKILKREFDGEEWVESVVSYTEYLDRLKPKEREKKMEKESSNTFLVFHSGKTIFSASTNVIDCARKHYYDFIDIITECYEDIEERIPL